MLRKLKRGTALALAMAVSFSIIGTLKPTKAYADFVGPKPPTKTVTVMKKDKSALTAEFDYTVGGKKLHYKRISDIREDPNFTLKEIEIEKPREGRTYYYTTVSTDGCSPGRGYIQAEPTNFWNADKDPNRTTGDDGNKHPQGYVKGYQFFDTLNSYNVKSLFTGYGKTPGHIVYDPINTGDGSDFLNQNHQLIWKGMPITLCMRGDFNNNIFFSTTKEAVLAHLSLDLASDLDPDDYSARPAYMEDRVGKEAGIQYNHFEDYLQNVKMNKSAQVAKVWHGQKVYMYESETFVLPPKTSKRWKRFEGKDMLLTGEYGDEVFHYYSPARVLGKRYLADYEVEDSVIIPDPPHPDKPDVGPCGRVVYNPDKCIWTNRGKISNGVGDYSVDIEATKPHIVLKGKTRSHDRCTRCGKHSCHTYTCHKSRDTFDVTYDLDRIESSGATNDTVRGGKGTIHIRQEGGGQEVRSTGYWKRPSYKPYYSQPYHDGCTMPKDPCNPQGHAGIYDIDWSDPIIQVQQKAPNKWKNNPYYQPIDVTVTDNLSGFNSSKSYIKITDISHYKHNYFTNLSEASLNEVKHWDLADGIYQIDIVVYDRAGNHSEYHDKWFKVDGIAPDINISDQGYHRAIDSLTFDTTVSDNIEELDELTVSGWGTYGSSKATLENQTKVVRPITYPNIKHEDTNYTFYYKVEDLATNQTTKSFVTSVVREYWKWAHTVYGKNFDTEVPIKILSSKDTKSLEGFTRSRTIDFDTWRGMKVEVWYKFVSYHNCNFIRVIHYDDPAMPVITGNGEKLYPDGKGGFKDAPPLSNEIGLEVGMDEYVESFGKHTDPKPIKTVDNGDGTVTNYYVNGDVRVIDKGGNLSSWKDKGFGTIIPETTEHEENRTIYHTSNRYRIEVTYNGSGSTIVVFDKNDKIVMRTSTSR